MAYQPPPQSPLPPQFQPQPQYNPSTPPPPPPKPSTHSSGRGTPLTGPPLPPPPPIGQSPLVNQTNYPQQPNQPQPYQLHNDPSISSGNPPIPPPDPNWLPDILKDKSTPDLLHLLHTPSLLIALLTAPSTSPPSIPPSLIPLQTQLSSNISLAQSLLTLEAHLLTARATTTQRLLSLRALERQWREKQSELDDALQEFSPRALYQRLSAAVAEQEALCRGLEESFLEGDGSGGVADEREVGEFVRRLREGKKLAYMRREQKERWDEGRVGGWR